MKIILLSLFTFIFYTMLVELSVEDTKSVTDNTKITEDGLVFKTSKKIDYQLKPEKKILRTTSSVKEHKIDQSLIDEALQFDKSTNSYTQAQESLEKSFLRSMADKQLSAQNSKEYKKQFIRAYLKKAKEAGYVIKLNNQLQVVSIQHRKTYDPILVEEE